MRITPLGRNQEPGFRVQNECSATETRMIRNCGNGLPEPSATNLQKPKDENP